MSKSLESLYIYLKGTTLVLWKGDIQVIFLCFKTSPCLNFLKGTVIGESCVKSQMYDNIGIIVPEEFAIFIEDEKEFSDKGYELIAKNSNIFNLNIDEYLYKFLVIFIKNNFSSTRYADVIEKRQLIRGEYDRLTGKCLTPFGLFSFLKEEPDDNEIVEALELFKEYFVQIGVSKVIR